MRNVTTIAVVLIASVASAASFRPMTLREKAEKADLIVVGTVLSIRQVMPTNELGYYISDDETSYMGPTSIGVVEVSEVWKQKDGVTRFFRSGVVNTAPRHVMVPCDYKFHEECAHRFSLSQNHRFWRSHILRFSCGPTSFS